MASITSQTFNIFKKIVTTNDKGADAFTTTTNPILDLFTETRKSLPRDLEEFKKLVRKIEAAKNADSEMFVRLLKFHRLIEKGNGMKGIYYICMMVLKEEDPVLYEYVLKWSREYPKDIMRLARISSMFNSTVSSTGEKIQMKLSTDYSIHKGRGTKMVKWTRDGMKSGNIHLNSNQNTVVSLSPEIVLYSNLLFDTIKQILKGNLYEDNVNLMLFKYMAYESSHFAVESNIIWKYVEQLMQNDPEISTLINTINTK